MIDVIFFDFDGVILDSMPVRDFGFRKMVEKYPNDLVNEFMEYHRYNAGLSRFHKIKYFYNELLHQEITEEKVQAYAQNFSEIMKAELVNKKYLIDETVEFIQKNQDKTMHIVSGSEEKELRYLCEQLKISDYFKSINGSPTHKNKLVENILNREKYDKKRCILIGDSITDYKAAEANEIAFYGYNNETLRKYGKYVDSFKEGL